MHITYTFFSLPEIFLDLYFSELFFNLIHQMPFFLKNYVKFCITQRNRIQTEYTAAACNENSVPYLRSRAAQIWFQELQSGKYQFFKYLSPEKSNQAMKDLEIKFKCRIDPILEPPLQVERFFFLLFIYLFDCLLSYFLCSHLYLYRVVRLFPSLC